MRYWRINYVKYLIKSKGLSWEAFIVALGQKKKYDPEWVTVWIES
jgi:hypothetical protein